MQTLIHLNYECQVSNNTPCQPAIKLKGRIVNRGKDAAIEKQWHTHQTGNLLALVLSAEASNWTFSKERTI